MAILVKDKTSFHKHLYNQALYKFVELKDNEYETELLTQLDKKLIIDTNKLKKGFVSINFYAYNVEFGIDTVEFIGKQKYLHFFTHGYTDDIGYDYRAQPMTFIYKEEEFLEISNIKEVKKMVGNIRLELVFSNIVDIKYDSKKILMREPRKITTYSNLYKKKMEHPQYCIYEGSLHYQNNLYQILTKYGINSKSNKHLYDILSEDLVYSFKFVDKEVYFIKNPTQKEYKVTNGRLASLWTWKLDNSTTYKMEDESLLYIKD